MSNVLSRMNSIGIGALFVLVSCLISTPPAVDAQVTIDARRPIGPATQYFGWDLKGYGKRVHPKKKALVYYEETPANLIRIPFFANAHSADGKIDEKQYANTLLSLRNIKDINPDVKVFASLKLNGDKTFPRWMESKNTGKIFNRKVNRPDPNKFSNALASYVEYFASKDVKFDCLGVINEVEHAVTPEEYLQTVRMLRKKLEQRELAEKYRSFVFVGPETFRVSPSIDYMKAITKLRGRDTLQIAGAHMYPNSHYEKNGIWSDFAKTLPRKVPMWHTEAHLGKHSSFEGVKNITLIRNAFAVLGGANREGVTGYVWWNDGHSLESVSQTSKRRAIQAMLGSRQVAVSPRHPVQMKIGEPGDLCQAYRKENTLHVFLIRNDDEAVRNFTVRLKKERIQKIVKEESYISAGDKIGEDATKENLKSAIIKNRRGFEIPNLPGASFSYFQLQLESRK